MVLASATKSGAMIGHFGPFRLTATSQKIKEPTKKKVPVERQKGKHKRFAWFALEAECRDKPNEWQVKVLDPAHFLLDVCPQQDCVDDRTGSPRLGLKNSYFLTGSYATSSSRALMLYNFTPVFQVAVLATFPTLYATSSIVACCGTVSQQRRLSVPRQWKIVSKEQIGILRVGTIKLLHSLSASVEPSPNIWNRRQMVPSAKRTRPSHESPVVFQAWSAKQNTSADQSQKAPETSANKMQEIQNYPSVPFPGHGRHRLNGNSVLRWLLLWHQRIVCHLKSGRVRSRGQGQAFVSSMLRTKKMLISSDTSKLHASPQDSAWFFENAVVSSLIASLCQVEWQGCLSSARWPNQHYVALVPKVG